MAPVQEA